MLAIFSALRRVDKSRPKKEQNLPDNFFVLIFLFFCTDYDALVDASHNCHYSGFGSIRSEKYAPPEWHRVWKTGVSIIYRPVSLRYGE